MAGPAQGSNSTAATSETLSQEMRLRKIEQEYIESLGEALSHTIEVPLAVICPVCGPPYFIETHTWPEANTYSPATCPDCGLYVEFYETGSDTTGEEYAIRFTPGVSHESITTHLEVT